MSLIFIRSYSSKPNIKDLFKQTMSRVSSQAMILTGGTNDPNSQLHGMTLSSVCSLSVYPRPLLQFNLQLPSYTSQSLHKYKYLGIHLLPPTSKSVVLSREFASGIKQETNKNLLKTTEKELKDGEIFHEMTTPFNKIHEDDWMCYSIKNNDIIVPVLKESERVLICKIEKNFIVENHEIWIASVLDVLNPNEKFNKECSGGLIYFNRGFHKIGNILDES